MIVEVKSVEKLGPIHSAQMITYLKLRRCPVGLVFNFNVLALRQGIRRLTNQLMNGTPSAPTRVPPPFPSRPSS